jgi:hypothetical protein
MGEAPRGEEEESDRPDRRRTEGDALAHGRPPIGPTTSWYTACMRAAITSGW